MPLYRYRCPSCSEATEIFQSSDNIAKRVSCQACGTFANREYGFEGITGHEWNKPVVSDAAAVHPSQIGEYRAFLKERTNKTYEFKPDGRIVFPNRTYRRAALRALGLHDRDGGYND